MTHEEIICRTKEPFDSIEEAKKTMKRMCNNKKKSRLSRRSKTLFVYKCEVCEKYHLTSQKKKK